MVSAQTWLDKEYPKDDKCLGEFDKKNKAKKREEITELDISKKGLEGSLSLEGFTKLKKFNLDTSDENNNGKVTDLDLTGAPKLEELDCSFNSIKNINLSNNKWLVSLNCSKNQLTNLNISSKSLKELWCSDNLLADNGFLTKLPRPKKLEILSLSNNNFSHSTLDFLSSFENLEELYLGTDDEKRMENNVCNRFHGSLEPLKEMQGLIKLDISATDIDSGTEYLPDGSILDKSEFIHSSKRENAGCLKIEDNRKVPYAAWDRKKRRKALREKIEIREKKRETETKTDDESTTFKALTEELKNRINNVVPIEKEDFKKIINKKTSIPGTIQGEIDFFSPWFNPNCAMVVSKIQVGYSLCLVVYEPPCREMEEILKVKNFPKLGWYSLDEAKKKSQEIKERIDGENPILAVSESISNPATTMERISLNPESIKYDPDNYLKPLDIIWRKIERNGKSTSAYHAAIYLGNNQVAHVSVGSDKNKEKDKEKEKSIDIRKITREDTKAQIGTWEYFLKQSHNELIRHHPAIPFKKPEKIIDNIVKTIALEYGKGEYNLFLENCEHFATLCVCGVTFSEQVDKTTLLGVIDKIDKVNLVKEIEKNNELFEKIKLEENELMAQIEVWQPLLRKD